MRNYLVVAGIIALFLLAIAFPAQASGECDTFYNHSGFIPGSYDYADFYEDGELVTTVQTNGQNIFVDPGDYDAGSKWDRVDKCKNSTTSTSTSTTSSTTSTSTTSTLGTTTSSSLGSTTSTLTESTTSITTGTSVTSSSVPTTTSETLPLTGLSGLEASELMAVALSLLAAGLLLVVAFKPSRT